MTHFLIYIYVITSANIHIRTQRAQGKTQPNGADFLIREKQKQIFLIFTFCSMKNMFAILGYACWVELLPVFNNSNSISISFCFLSVFNISKRLLCVWGMLYQRPLCEA